MASIVFYDEAQTIRHRSYYIEYRHSVREVICPQYAGANNDGDKDEIIIPDYLIPRKRYPVCVYLYGIWLYCKNPDMGQRAAAEATRKMFGLEKFSHTTLGRTIKALERSIKATTGTEATEVGDTQPTGTKKVFPSTSDTLMRRERIAAYLNGLSGKATRNEIIKACRGIVADWYDKTRRLLL